MIRSTSVAVALLLLATPAAAETLPSRLADSVGGDPKAATPECAAAQADARAWTEGGVGKVLKGVGRVAIWPLGERSARRRSDEQNAARERVMERVRQACITQPELTRAPHQPDQRWPGGKGYDRELLFRATAGGRTIIGLVHPTARTIWLKTGEDGPGHLYWAADAWTGVAAWALEPTGCKVTEDQPGPGFTREVGYVCPAGIDLRELTKRQPAVKDGARFNTAG
jgi:hypothetical protein